MLIGIPKETREGATLVAGTPDTTAKLIKLGYEVCIESGAGLAASYGDDLYEAAGASVVGRDEAWGADIVVCLDAPAADSAEFALMRKGAVLLARMAPGNNPELLAALKAKGCTALALDMVPRLSRAQALDVRSSMMNVAGNRAVIEAASAFGRLFAGQVTAAGKVAPAKVYVIGVGVAGLAAIGAAGSMGAQVYATDVRAEVADQVASLGATFVEIPVKQESSDGYAKALTDEQQQMVLEVYRRQAAQSDIVITTAQVPGRAAPLLLDDEAVAGMKPGSVIVDMGASPLGGNCALSRADEAFTTEGGVTIIGYSDLPSRLPGQSSQLFGQNVVNLFKLVTKAKDGVPVWDMDDEVVRGMTAVLDGESMWPPPAVKVSAAPAQKPAAQKSAAQGGAGTASGATDTAATASVSAAGTASATTSAAGTASETASAASAAGTDAGAASMPKGLWWKVLAACILAALVWFAPADMQSHFVVFALAVVVGFYVITGVSHSLHTPLMSVTNAISGIIIVGAILLAGSSNPIVAALSFVAMVIASINIFGGFLVTRRMLKMFAGSSE